MSTLFELASDLARAQAEHHLAKNAFTGAAPQSPALAALQLKNETLGLKFARETIIHQNSALAQIRNLAADALEGKTTMRDALSEILFKVDGLP